MNSRLSRKPLALRGGGAFGGICSSGEKTDQSVDSQR